MDGVGDGGLSGFSIGFADVLMVKMVVAEVVVLVVVVCFLVWMVLVFFVSVVL